MNTMNTMNTNTMNTTAPDLYRVNWVELDLAPIVDRYGWEATIAGLESLLPLGQSLIDMIASIEDQAIEDLTEQSTYTEWHDRAGYRSDCF